MFKFGGDPNTWAGIILYYDPKDKPSSPKGITSTYQNLIQWSFLQLSRDFCEIGNNFAIDTRLQVQKLATGQGIKIFETNIQCPVLNG